MSGKKKFPVKKKRQATLLDITPRLLLLSLSYKTNLPIILYSSIVLPLFVHLQAAVTLAQL